MAFNTHFNTTLTLKPCIRNKKVCASIYIWVYIHCKLQRISAVLLKIQVKSESYLQCQTVHYIISLRISQGWILTIFSWRMLSVLLCVLFQNFLYNILITNYMLVYLNHHKWKVNNFILLNIYVYIYLWIIYWFTVTMW